MEAELWAFLTAELDGDEWTGSRPRHFAWEKGPPLPIVESREWLSEPVGLGGGERKISRCFLAFSSVTVATNLQAERLAVRRSIPRRSDACFCHHSV
jgi:hypothetical protein